MRDRRQENGIKRTRRRNFVVAAVEVLGIISVFTIGFSAWVVQGDEYKIEANVAVGEYQEAAPNYNIVSNGSQSYIDMRFTKRVAKSEFTEPFNAADPETTVIVSSKLGWKNVNSAYNDDLSEYFYLTDIDNPLGDNAPKMYNHETRDTVGFDCAQTIDRTTNEFTCEIAYVNAFQSFQTTLPSSWSWDAYEPVYDTAYETPYTTNASYGGEWETVATNFTSSQSGLSFLRADLRALKKNDKYYFFILYVFHFTTLHTCEKGQVCRYRQAQLTTFSSQSLEQASDLVFGNNSSVSTPDTLSNWYVLTNNDNKATSHNVSIRTRYKRTAAATTYTNLNWTIYPSTPYAGQSSGKTYGTNVYYGENPNCVIAMTNPSTYKALSRTIYREVDGTMPIVGNAWVKSVSSTAITWNYSYTYYIKHVQDPVTRNTPSAITTPLNYEFDHFELVYANQYAYTASAQFYFKSTADGTLLTKTYNDNISARPRYYYYKVVDRIKEDFVTLDINIRLRPKNDTVKATMANYLKAYAYSFEFEVSTRTYTNLSGK